jgi:hypothetical protein
MGSQRLIGTCRSLSCRFARSAAPTGRGVLAPAGSGNGWAVRPLCDYAPIAFSARRIRSVSRRALRAR